MNPDDHHLPELSVAALISRLSAMTSSINSRGPFALAFDGDGTLWSGDVSDDVFFAACEEEWFLQDARAPLVEALNGISEVGSGETLGAIAQKLFSAHASGKVDERRLFEAMTFCYAGRLATEVTNYARQVLVRKGINERIRWGLVPLLDWARREGHECFLVTASPAPIVEVPALNLGFAADHIVASCATGVAGEILSHVVEPIPYREQKVAQLMRRVPGHRLLSAFGDSPFDIDLLRAAELAVAVEPKPGLVQELRYLPKDRTVAWLVNR